MGQFGFKFASQDWDSEVVGIKESAPSQRNANEWTGDDSKSDAELCARTVFMVVCADYCGDIVTPAVLPSWDLYELPFEFKKIVQLSKMEASSTVPRALTQQEIDLVEECTCGAIENWQAMAILIYRGRSRCAGWSRPYRQSLMSSSQASILLSIFAAAPSDSAQPRQSSPSSNSSQSHQKMKRRASKSENTSARARGSSSRPSQHHAGSWMNWWRCATAIQGTATFWLRGRVGRTARNRPRELFISGANGSTMNISIHTLTAPTSKIKNHSLNFNKLSTSTPKPIPITMPKHSELHFLNLDFSIQTSSLRRSIALTNIATKLDLRLSL